jgi:predicted site-specific integrase-resolvase
MSTPTPSDVGRQRENCAANGLPFGKERRIPESEIRRILGITEDNADAVVLYGRVSGHGQRDDLETQVKCLEAEFAPRFAKVYTQREVLTPNSTETRF